MKQLSDSQYKWFILILASLTNALVSAAPSMCLPVLFQEISGELNLNLVQVGAIWGISALPGIVTVLIGGTLGDRFGPKRILIITCLLAGLTGALRGLVQDFSMLVATTFLLGALTPIVVMNNIKACGIWFPRHQLGLANGFLSMGMALGFLVGSMTSATWLSPWLGGWRNVLIFAGIGNLFAPSLGNSLAGISPALPFVFWAALIGMGLIGLSLTRGDLKEPAIEQIAPKIRAA